MAERKMEIITPTKTIKKAVKCSTPEQAYKIFRDVLYYEEYELRDQEHFWVMGIDASGYVVCVYIASIGADNMVIIDPVEIFDIAIAKHSTKVILAHTHPKAEGKVKPSEEDFDFTNMLYHACLPFRIEIIDHIILGISHYYSFLRSKAMLKIFESRTYKPYNQIKEVLDKEKEEEKKIAVENKAIEIVKKMTAKRYTLEQISEVTGFETEEIEDIIIELDRGK